MLTVESLGILAGRPPLDSEVNMIFDGPALFLVVLLICAAALAVRS
jgi:hypothetical protein